MIVKVRCVCARRHTLRNADRVHKAAYGDHTQTWPFPKLSTPFLAFIALPRAPTAQTSLTVCLPPGIRLHSAKAQ